MRYGFKYHGIVKDTTVFSIVKEVEDAGSIKGRRVRYLHFLADENLNVMHVSYMNKYLCACMRTETYRNGITLPPRSDTAYTYVALEFLSRLVKKDVHLGNLGYIRDLKLDIIKNYTFEVLDESGCSKQFYYDGANKAEAMEKALVNNKDAVKVRLLSAL
ncbi:MAG: hypothetical protein ACI35P_01620 [Bacillus sp. (in: firmicutes)]